MNNGGAPIVITINVAWVIMIMMMVMTMVMTMTTAVPGVSGQWWWSQSAGDEGIQLDLRGDAGNGTSLLQVDGAVPCPGVVQSLLSLVLPRLGCHFGPRLSKVLV